MGLVPPDSKVYRGVRNNKNVRKLLNERAWQNAKNLGLPLMLTPRVMQSLQEQRRVSAKWSQ